MKESTHEIVFESSDWHRDQTAHGLLVLAHQHATQAGLFAGLKRYVSLPMKTVTYSVHDKLATLWASIIADCDHTVEINFKLGAHERALAALFGLERFPDQSGINRLLRAATPETVVQMRRLHVDLLARNGRARRRRLRRKLARGRVLFVDFDQRGIAVQGKHYELAEAGYFTRKRSHRGYQLSMAFLGGPLGEVLDEYFDPGKTPASARVEESLESLDRLRQVWGLEASQVVVRGDAQYGTPAIIAKVVARGFGFLVKGINPKRAHKLARQVDETAFVSVSPRAEGEPRWVADLGERSFTARATAQAPKLEVRARAIVVKWIDASVPGPKRPGPTSRARRAGEPKPTRTCYAMLMTNLAPEVLPAAMALECYDDRATIERYFRDEQCALGARSVRTHKAAGAAVFQWMVAIANNLLQWMRAQYFSTTALAAYGVGRLVKRAFQIPARVVRRGSTLRVIFPQGHLLAAAIVAALTQHAPISPAPGPAPPLTPH
ncbi:MAG TPA: transposase [Polyangia bacterium]